MVSRLFARQKDELRRRQQAYSRVFKKNDPDVEYVIRDLMKFSRYHKAPDVTPTSEGIFIQIGRREVVARIFDNLTMDLDELLEIYHTGRQTDVGTDDGT